MEYDCYQHYFLDDFDTEEDFYKSTAPSEDIWKKFELLLTPPMSPTRTLSSDVAMHLSPGDKLSLLTKVLGQDDEYDGQFVPNTRDLFGNLSSIIIQDCMWSSFSASKHLEKANERSSSTGEPRVPQISTRACKALGTSPNASLSNTLATDCVDPTAVLTFPTNGYKKPASSGSESRSDSSDDDDDDEEDDEEEEIDVVTVESKQNRGRPVSHRKPVTITVRTDTCPSRFHVSVHRQQHNYAAPSPDSDVEPDNEEDEEEDEEPQSKRTCLESSRHTTSSASTSHAGSSSSESPQSSDTEDSDRRRNHNFLERKRRNDLRSRFLALRDQVPGLVDSPKTPKVAILTQATEYLLELHVREKQWVQEKKRLRTRQQQLLRRLAELKRC